MDRDFRRGSLTIDFAAQPFDSAARVLGRSAAVFFSNLPFLAGLTLAVFLPGNLLLQLACSLLDVPADGILSYIVLEIGDLIFGALVTGAVIYALVGKFRTGRMPPAGDALRWGRRLWARLLWNQFKVEITVGLWALLLFIPGIIAAVRLALVDPVVAVEGASEPEPLRRSRELTVGVRWRVFFVLAPLAILDAVGNFGVLRALPGAGHSRVLLAVTDSVLAVISQWTTAAALLMYVGRVGPAKAPAPQGSYRQSRSR